MNRTIFLALTTVFTFSVGVAAALLLYNHYNLKSKPVTKNSEDLTEQSKPIEAPQDDHLFGYTGNHFALDSEHFFGVTAAPKKKLVKSNDGGRKWQKIDLSVNQELEKLLKDSPIELFFVSNLRGWITGNEETWETIDGGNSWNKIYAHKTFDQMFFSDAGNGWMNLFHDGSYRSYLTNDGGKTWKPCQRKTESGEEISHSYFISKMEGWAFLERNEKLFFEHTTNAGCDWTSVWKFPFDNELRISDLFFINEQTGWFSTIIDNGLFQTNNGGKSWKRLNIPNEKAEIETFFFKDKNEGWLLFASLPEEPIFYQTFDGGRTWVKGNRNEFLESYQNDVKFPHVSDGLRRAIVIQSINSKI